ncbi:MAG TPA: PIG-L family deacetylase [Gemmatimonadaceae bacterium]|nr:PIG-L family deacetylase [Gemmatimonadaceae bacterium]
MELKAISILRTLALFFAGQTPGTGRIPGDIRLLPNYGRPVDVIVVAHEDDWQLFMGDILTTRLRLGNRGVFVYLTAGDDGRDSTYWQTRERAALQSTRIAAGLSIGQPLSCSVVEIHQHPIKRCVDRDIESYFLRLPDGKRNGKGFSRYGHQSLRKLRAKPRSEISAIDASTTYRGLTDLMTTVGEIAQLDSTAVTVHTSDPSIRRNPHDHFDHRITGLLVQDLRKQHRVAAMYYLGYALATRAPNRSTGQVQAKTTLLLAYDREMMAVNQTWSAYREHRAFYSQCMERTYAVRSPVPDVH